jgi:hypothetical protein
MEKDLKEIFYDYIYRDYFLAKMKNNSLVVIFKAYGKSSPLQDEFENLIDVNSIEREANSKEYYDYFTQRGIKKGALCSRWQNDFKPISNFLESKNNYDPQPIVVTLGHGKHFPNGHGMAINNYTFDFKNNSLLSKTKEPPKTGSITESVQTIIDNQLNELEELKKETLEEVAERIYQERFHNPYLEEVGGIDIKSAMIKLANWQKEQDKKMYSEEDLQKAFDCGVEQCVKRGGVYSRAITDWDEIKKQFKK